jgi:uncharacterized protein (TIGR03435 family)
LCDRGCKDEGGANPTTYWDKISFLTNPGSRALEYAVEPGSIMYRPPVKGEAEFPPLATALRQFGLSMTPAKGPGQFLVFDRVERPSEN